MSKDRSWCRGPALLPAIMRVRVHATCDSLPSPACGATHAHENASVVAEAPAPRFPAQPVRADRRIGGRRGAARAGAGSCDRRSRCTSSSSAPGSPGLVSAYELEKRGHRVTILEADARHIGGRVRTLRFGDGRYGEAGAMRIPTRHLLTRHYVSEFALPLRKFVFSNPQAYYFMRGERHRIADVAAVARLYQLTDAERNKTPDDLWADSVGKALATLDDADRKDLVAESLTSPRVRAFDQKTLQQLCEDAGLSDEAIEFMAVAGGSETILPTAATETLREEMLEVWSQGFDEIVGGTDTLATAFARKLQIQAEARLRSAAAHAIGGWPARRR